MKSGDSLTRLIAKDLARRILKDEITVLNSARETTRLHLNRHIAENQKLKAELTETKKQLALINGAIHPEEKKSLIVFTAFLTVLPFLLLNMTTLKPEIVAGHLKFTSSLDSKNLQLVALFFFTTLIACLVSKSATVRHDLTGTMKHKFEVSGRVISRVDFALALATAAVYCLGLWGVSDPWNLLGLCLTLTLILVPPLLRR